jgi:AraC family transcriptional regulator
MAEIKIKKTKACRLAYVEHVGEYGSIPYNRYFAQLYGWAKEKKIRPGFQPMVIFYDDPSQTPPEKCRSEIGIPITGDAKPEGNIKIKDLPPMEVAVIQHKAPAKEYPETYRKLSEWMAKNGYEWAGPSIEVYTKKPKVEGDEVILYANVQVPIKKK